MHLVEQRNTDLCTQETSKKLVPLLKQSTLSDTLPKVSYKIFEMLETPSCKNCPTIPMHYKTLPIVKQRRLKVRHKYLVSNT